MQYTSGLCFCFPSSLPSLLESEVVSWFVLSKGCFRNFLSIAAFILGNVVSQYAKPDIRNRMAIAITAVTSRDSAKSPMTYISATSVSLLL